MIITIQFQVVVPLQHFLQPKWEHKGPSSKSAERCCPSHRGLASGGQGPGRTFEEALFVNALNDPTNSNNSANAMQESSPLLLRQKKLQDVHCLLGSNCVLTAGAFLKEVESIFQS